MIETVFLSNISIKHKVEVKKDDIGVSQTTQLVDERLYTKHPPRLFGIERAGILDSRVKDFAKRYYTAENTHSKPNRIKIDCVAKQGKIFNSINLQPKDVEIVDINPQVYLQDRHLGLNQLLMLIDQVNSGRESYALKFSFDNVPGTEEVVYDILNRLSVYKNSYWEISLLTIRIKDLEYIVSKGKNDRVLDFVTNIPNVAIAVDDTVMKESFVTNMLKVSPRFNVLFLIRRSEKVSFTRPTQIINSCKANIIVAESELVSMLGTGQKYIELVTGEAPEKPILGLPHSLYYCVRAVEKITKVGNEVKMGILGGDEMTIRTPSEVPTIILHNRNRKVGTRLMEGNAFRTLLLDDPLDLPYVMVAKLQELLVK